MASNTELLEKLTNQTSIPGLDVDTLLEASFEAKFKDQLSAASTPEARQQLKDALYESYVEANKDRLTQGIAEFKSGFETAKVQINSVIAQAKEVVTTAAVPNVIGTAGPNPLRELLEMKSKKETLETILATASDSLVRVILVAEKIDYKIPQSVIDVIELVAVAKNVLAAIPTKLS